MGAGSHASEMSVAAQNQPYGKSAGQTILSMVQGPTTQGLHGATSRWADASDTGSDCSTADTVDQILAAANVATGASKPTDASIVPQLGSPELPTVGSKGHSLGTCKPCAFTFKEVGCQSGVNCVFCHLC